MRYNFYQLGPHIFAHRIKTHTPVKSHWFTTKWFTHTSKWTCVIN